MRTQGKPWGDPENDPREAIIVSPTIARVNALVAAYTPETPEHMRDVGELAEARRKQLRGEPPPLDEEDGDRYEPQGRPL